MLGLFKKIVSNCVNIASIIFAVETSPLWCVKRDWVNRRVSHSRICECYFPPYFSQCLWWLVIKVETYCILNITPLFKYSSVGRVLLCIHLASDCWLTANYELERMWKEAVMSLAFYLSRFYWIAEEDHEKFGRGFRCGGVQQERSWYMLAVW